MVSLKQDIFLECYAGNLVILNQHIFPNGLDGVLLLLVWQSSQEHFTEGSFTKLADDFEILKFHLARSPLLQSRCSFHILSQFLESPCI